MASQAQIREQVAAEDARRARLSVPAFGGGFLYLLSAIVITSTLNSLPTVGPLQGLAPALSGVAKPGESPRTAEVKYISHHAFALVAGSVLAALAVVILMLILVLLFDAASFRRPQTWPPARLLVLIGGIAVALASVAHEIVYAVETHNFAVGADHTNHAVDQALTKSAANEIVAYLSLLAGLALVVGMVVVLINSLRTGLLPRWMAFLGMFSGLLILLPNVGATLQLVPAFWMVMMGLLYSKRWPGQPPRGGDPPAWEAGEARPWPTRAELQAERAAARGEPLPAGAGAPAPAPAPAPRASSRKRRRKGR
jgi:hypothetical protein